jgi:hypothetical protein
MEAAQRAYEEWAAADPATRGLRLGRALARAVEWERAVAETAVRRKKFEDSKSEDSKLPRRKSRVKAPVE